MNWPIVAPNGYEDIRFIRTGYPRVPVYGLGYQGATFARKLRVAVRGSLQNPKI